MLVRSNNIRHGTLSVNKDGTRIAYVAVFDDGEAVVSERIGEKGYRGICDKIGDRFDEVGPPIFHPMLNTYAYWARVGDKFCMVIDDARQSLFDSVTDFVWKPSYELHYAYMASCGSENYVIYNKLDIRKNRISRARAPVFVPNTSDIAYTVTAGNREYLALNYGNNEERGPAFDSIQSNTVHFSKDGLCVAYIAHDNDETILVAGKWPGEKYKLLPCFSVFVGDRHGFVGEREGKCYAVIDAEPGPACDDISTLRFSENGRSYAYVAHKGDEQYVVFNGQWSMPWKEVRDVVILPDGSTAIYAARCQLGWSVYRMYGDAPKDDKQCSQHE